MRWAAINFKAIMDSIPELDDKLDVLTAIEIHTTDDIVCQACRDIRDDLCDDAPSTIPPVILDSNYSWTIEDFI